MQQLMKGAERERARASKSFLYHNSHDMSEYIKWTRKVPPQGEN